MVIYGIEWSVEAESRAGHEFLCGPWRTKNYWHSFLRRWRSMCGLTCVRLERKMVVVYRFFSLAMETTDSRVWNQSVRASYDEWSNRFRELFDLFSSPNELERHSVNRDALNWTETSKPVNQLFLLVFIVRVIRGRGRIQYEIYYSLI